MGHIKEPDGVDFFIKSRPLTKTEEIAISNYIKAQKAKKLRKQASSKLIDKATSHKKTLA